MKFSGFGFWVFNYLPPALIGINIQSQDKTDNAPAFCWLLVSDCNEFPSRDCGTRASHDGYGKSFRIETAECGLLELDEGKMALIVKRLDRVDGWKLPMEDMCQLSDRLSEEKYRGSMKSIGKIILKQCANSGFDALRFFEVTLFCFLTGNADRHFKNFSLIRSTDGEIQYAAAYDLLPTTLLLSQDTEESALTIHGKKCRFRWLDFLAFGSAFQLTERRMVNAISRFEKGLPTAIQLIQQGFCSENMRNLYKQLVLDRWARLMPQMP